VLLVLSYIACANFGLRKHLQGHLKERLTYKNFGQKVTKLFAVLKQQRTVLKIET
jgi:hypothetical protein